MTKTKSTKRALLMSALSLLLCVSMLVGTTFAWFTDSVTSGSNIIKSGNLDAEMYWADGDEAPATATWTDASTGAIFDYALWEPGYTQARHLRIANVGSLSFDYQLRITTTGTVSKLADVIDVYFFADAKAITRADVETGTYMGTLTQVLGTDKNIANTVKGFLEEGKTEEVTIALKMQESAGNEYQNLTVAADFSVELIATQHVLEQDSFGADYDEKAPSPEIPAALVRALEDRKIDTTGSKMGVDLGIFDLDTAYQFEPTESYAQALESEMRYWHADFVVSADKDVAPDSLALAGYYEAWCSLNDYKWVALTSPDTITAGTEIRLVEAMGQGRISVNYENLCDYGNDGKGFRCGAADLNGSNAGTTLTVELRMYETYTAEEAIKLGYGNTVNREKGPEHYVTIGKFTYTFS